MKRIIVSLLSIFISYSVLAQTQKYQIINDIQYRSERDSYIQKRCKLDIYYPENSKDFPTVVWFHGGGLTGGNKDIPEELTNSDLALIAVNYRLYPKASVQNCIEDAAAAVNWAFKEIEKYGGSTDKIFVAGHSAGAYLTSMIGLDKKWLEKYDIDADLIAGLFPFSGNAISHLAYRDSKGMKDTQPFVDEFAPLYHIRPDAPPYIIISGDRELEMIGRYEENAYLWRMMKVIGHKETYLYEIGGYDHGAMAAPAFHILKNHIKQILNNK